ncbi:hypothetical protein [Ralstonia phage phiRSL1]|uniref:Uncharacterized protein n=1 Tax=Ralstonia phage phiRSL1 TaxID=1980924 RepID=B2ZY38_9CAUD|nr:hypothetical protein RSL1_ORF167 [Ralstonia phage phiRSL1]BAG41614.1 hypothetical protein [Ralstonia phage phiRSL1]
MNDKQLEVAARELCRIRGIDPDSSVAHGADPNPDGSVYGVLLYSPAWTRVAREVKAHLEVHRAVSRALFPFDTTTKPQSAQD